MAKNNLIQVGGELKSVAYDGIVADAKAVYDYTLEKTQEDINSEKQDTLVSGTNIKTINNESILGSGNITIEGGGESQEITGNYTTGSFATMLSTQGGNYSVYFPSSVGYFTLYPNESIEANSSNSSSTVYIVDKAKKVNPVTGVEYDVILASETEEVTYQNDTNNIKEVKVALSTASTEYDYTINTIGIPKEALRPDVQDTLDKADNAQETLVSGTNIKTINNESVLGSGNIEIGGAVASVNGKTGVVVLDAEDVGAASDAQLQSVADAVATNTQDIAANAQDIATLQAAYEGLTQSDIVIGALPSSGAANTIYRVPSTSSYSDYMWNGSQFVLMATYTIPADAGIYDISANNSGASYNNLTAALGTNGANVPSASRKGGMSVKYLENVYADYDVVVTEGLTTEPTGTELDAALTLTDGTYKAAELTSVSTLPANPYNSVLYYIEVAGDTTTYTQWVITKKTNDSTKYVHWVYTSSSVENADFVKLDNWVGSLEDKVDIITKNVEDANDTSYAFTTKYYIAQATGIVTSNSSWRGTGYIPVKEGDEFYYRGTPSASSLGVAGYAYDGSTYTYKQNIVPKTATTDKTHLFVVGKGITHIYATTVQTYVAATFLKKRNTSVLSNIVDGFGGNISNYRIITGYTTGKYVKTDGTWQSNNAFLYSMFDIEAGDTIELVNTRTSNLEVAVLAKKISETPEFKVLISPSDTNFRDYKYVATENMTICVSGSSSPSLTLIRKNKIAAMNARIGSLENNQQSIIANNNWLKEYDLKLGYMFNNIAAIGDSMSVGTLEGSIDSTAKKGASWLSVLAKRWGCISREHYALGGTTCYTWLNDASTYGLGKLLNDANIYNAYFIAYGHNDTQSVGSATDTAAPVTITDGVPSCASGYSFCAYYKAIIDQIRTKAPHAIIFCLSEYDDVVMSRNSGAYSQAIKDVADWYYEQGDQLVHRLDTGGVGSGMALGGHYSTQGYIDIAKRVDQEANKVIYKNRSDTQIKEFGIYNNSNI